MLCKHLLIKLFYEISKLTQSLIQSSLKSIGFGEPRSMGSGPEDQVLKPLNSVKSSAYWLQMGAKLQGQSGAGIAGAAPLADLVVFITWRVWTSSHKRFVFKNGTKIAVETSTEIWIILGLGSKGGVQFQGHTLPLFLLLIHSANFPRNAFSSRWNPILCKQIIPDFNL